MFDPRLGVVTLDQAGKGLPVNQIEDLGERRNGQYSWPGRVSKCPILLKSLTSIFLRKMLI